MLEGEAGIGKTTLWQQGLDRASALSYRVLSCRPSGTETRVSFAALGDLLEPVVNDVLPALPEPQCRALAVALLLEDPAGTGPSQRAIALAFLGVIRALAEREPVAIAVDDIQWLDGSSLFVLEFALRRLQEEPVAVLLTIRASEAETSVGLDHAFPEDRIQRMSVEPLSLGAIHRLLNNRLGLVLSRPRLRRVHELSGGNPFCALELGRAFKRGAIRIERGESLPGRLAALVNDRLVGLPADTREALLVASALSQPTIELVGRAGIREPADRLAPALEGNVIEVENGRIRFSHPMLASGVYAAIRPSELRALHRRLADAVPDPEERARHLALAAEGPKADVASALEEAARRAHSRGALEVATELSLQARQMTPPDREDERRERAIQAVAYAFESGESSRARALLEETLTSAPAGPPRALALYWLGYLQEYEGDRRRAVKLFHSALLEVGDDEALRSRIEGELASALFLMRRDLARAAQHAETAVSLAEQNGDVPALVVALAQQGLADAIIGRSEWRDALRRGIDLEREAESIPLTETSSFGLAAILTWTDEFDEARRIFRSLRERADERAEEGALPWILANLGLVEYLAGRWEEASRCAEEGSEIALQTGQGPQGLFAKGVRALVRAARGDEGARSDAEAALASGEKGGVMVAGILGASALAVLELSHGYPELVHALLGPLGERLEKAGVREPGSVRFLPDEIEALIDLDRLAEAEALLARLERRARRLDRASALAAAARCRGLLAAAGSDLDGALTSLERAMSEHERVSMPFERARTLLVLGSTRRRAKRKREARDALDEALSIFEDLGARPWSGKTREELARIGGRPRATGSMTPTERQVAALVAEGRSNKEVAAALFVTVKTVESHLSRVYAKLGVRSRTELAHRLTAETRGTRRVNPRGSSDSSRQHAAYRATRGISTQGGAPMGTKLKLAAVVACLLGFVGVTVAAAGSPRTDDRGSVTTLHLVAKEVDSTFLDLGDTDFSVGDQLAFSNDLYHAGKKVGKDAGWCVVARLTASGASTFKCVGSNALPGGQITVQGLVTYGPTEEIKAEPYRFAITGGTGRYREADGEVRIEELGGGVIDLTFIVG